MEDTQKRNFWAVYVFFSLNTAIIMWFFWRSTQYDPFTSTAAMFKAVGHVSGLLLSFLILSQTLLMSKLQILEHAFGKEKLNKLHHDIGYLILALIILHPLSLTLGYNMLRHPGLFNQFKDFVLHFEDVLAAFVGTLLFLTVVVTSVYFVKKRVKYEYWYYVHLLSYLAILMTFLHQVNTGPDFIGNTTFQAYWYALYGLTALTIAWFRFARPVVMSFRHGLRVAKVVQETHDTYSIYVTGKDIGDISYEAGQFASLRFLSSSLWLQSHPFSYSSAPGKSYLRFTIKKLGDYTDILDSISIGTRVIHEGPMGKLVPSTTDTNVLLIGGGVGITPLRAMLEPLLKRRATVSLIYCVRTPNDIVFKEEFDSVEHLPNLSITYIYSQQAPSGQSTAHLDKTTLSRLATDLQNQKAYICGPQGLMDTATHSLRELGMPSSHIHAESFSY